MKTIEETRRARLKMLEKEYGGMAALCRELKSTKTQESGLNRIANENKRHERGGKPYEMGSKIAREIETALNLPTGWMDTPPSYAELHGQADLKAMALMVMEQMPEDMQRQALRLLDALAQPAVTTGT